MTKSSVTHCLRMNMEKKVIITKYKHYQLILVTLNIVVTKIRSTFINTVCLKKVTTIN